MGKPKAYELSYKGDQYLGTPYGTGSGEIDCQKLWELMLKGVGISVNLAGSNAWYREMMKNGWVGTPEECKQKFGYIPEGAALFILKQDGREPAKYKADGIGNASHIGVVTHRTAEEMIALKIQNIPEENVADRKAFREKVSHGNWAIHASSTRGCVATSDFHDRTIEGGWNRVGLWNRLSYNTAVDTYFGNNESVADIVSEVKTMMETYQVVGGTLNLRAKKDRKSARLAELPEGMVVNVLDKTDAEWWKIRTAYDDVGYVMSQFLEPVVDERSIEERVADLEKRVTDIESQIGVG